MVVWDIVISLFIIGCVALAVYILYRDHRDGRGCCGCKGGCHCSGGCCSEDPQLISIEENGKD